MKSCAGIAGNDCANAIAKYQANQANIVVAGTGIHSTGPDGKLSSKIFWFTKEKKGACYGHSTCILSQTHLPSKSSKCPKIPHAYKSQTWIQQSQTGYNQRAPTPTIKACYHTQI
eukprot:13148-Pelagomonas_calceolata.AAC.1